MDLNVIAINYLQNHTTLKRRRCVMCLAWRFRGLQNYTTLKLNIPPNLINTGFRGLQNYTTLKQATYRKR